jgi:hypothetical protein
MQKRRMANAFCREFAETRFQCRAHAQFHNHPLFMFCYCVLFNVTRCSEFLCVRPLVAEHFNEIARWGGSHCSLVFTLLATRRHHQQVTKEATRSGTGQETVGKADIFCVPCSYPLFVLGVTDPSVSETETCWLV